MTEILDVAPGLWLWRAEHPDWGGDPDEWEPTVTCTCVESRGEVVLLDPLEGGQDVARRLEARPPTLIAVLKPDHVRDVDAFARRYGIRAYGPRLFFPDDVPESELLIWASAGHEQWTLPAFRAMLELPFERVIVSHGEPVHDRAAFERALRVPMWPDGG